MQKLTITQVQIGDRACYTIPERGGYSFSFGKVTKLNKVTVEVSDEKHFHGQQVLVDKRKVYEVIRFNDTPTTNN